MKKWSNYKTSGFWLFTACIAIPLTALAAWLMEWSGWFSRDVVILAVVTGMTGFALEWVMSVHK